MAEGICARDLMRTEFVRIEADKTLGDAVATLLATQREARLPSALMVVDGDDHYLGMLTARLLIRLLVGSAGTAGTAAAAPTPEPVAEDLSLLVAARERLAVRIADVLVAGIPIVAPQDRLLTLIRRGVTVRLDFVPVVEHGKPVGFAPVTAIFQAAAGIALTPEDEGVRFDR